MKYWAPVIGSLLGLVIVAGAGLFWYASTLDYYEPGGRDALQAADLRLGGLDRDARWQQWYEARERFESPRKMLEDRALSWILGGVSASVLLWCYGFPLPAARSPRWKFAPLGWWLCGVALLLAGTPLQLLFEQLRYDYPSWGDSIIIGMVQMGMLGVLLGVLGVVLQLGWGWFLAFPGRLWGIGNLRNWKYYLITPFFMLPGLFLSYAWLENMFWVRHAEMAAALSLPYFVYAVFSVRSGLLRRFAPRAARN